MTLIKKKISIKYKNKIFKRKKNFKKNFKKIIMKIKMKDFKRMKIRMNHYKRKRVSKTN